MRKKGKEKELVKGDKPQRLSIKEKRKLKKQNNEKYGFFEFLGDVFAGMIGGFFEGIIEVIIEAIFD